MYAISGIRCKTLQHHRRRSSTVSWMKAMKAMVMNVPIPRVLSKRSGGRVCARSTRVLIEKRSCFCCWCGDFGPSEIATANIFSTAVVCLRNLNSSPSSKSPVLHALRACTASCQRKRHNITFVLPECRRAANNMTDLRRRLHRISCCRTHLFSLHVALLRRCFFLLLLLFSSGIHTNADRFRSLLS